MLPGFSVRKHRGDEPAALNDDQARSPAAERRRRWTNGMRVAIIMALAYTGEPGIRQRTLPAAETLIFTPPLRFHLHDIAICLPVSGAWVKHGSPKFFQPARASDRNGNCVAGRFGAGRIVAAVNRNAQA
jgi:hypothetical protein